MLIWFPKTIIGP